MTALLLSIVLSTYLVLCFKFFSRYKIDNLQAIIFNYITCVITGIIFTQEVPDIPGIIHSRWFPIAITLGCSFFFIFNLMGYVARNIGVTITSVASKLSMVIPVTVALIIYKEEFSIVKFISLLLAIVAVFLSSVKIKTSDHHLDVKGLFLAFAIFLGSGLNDTLVNYASTHLMEPIEFFDFNISIFAFAALCGTLVLLFQIIFLKHKIQMKALIAGIILGIPNYFSLLFLIQALNVHGWNSSVVFPINNMGIVVLSAVSAYLLFKEKFSSLNLTGLVIGILAIGLMIIG